MTGRGLIRVGQIRGAFGVKGEVRIASFTETPDSVFAYGDLLDADGAVRLTVRSWRPVKNGFAVRAAEVGAREEAEALKGQALYAPRDALPAPGEDEFYRSDLIGMDVRDLDGADLGRVKAVADFGGGDLLEISDTPGVKASWYLPFTRDYAPEIDAEARIITIDPPDGLIPD